LAVRATEIYAKYPDEFDAEARGLARSGQMRRDLANLHPILTPDQSRALNQSWDPSIIIAGSGMCEGGRIVHHLKHNLWRRGVQVLMTSFMAEGSLGRRLVEGAKSVRIFREDIVVRADIRTVGGLSAHAGQGGLLDWIAPAADARPRVVLTHGEQRQRAGLAGKLAQRFGLQADSPERLAVIEL
jgi:metallo-beta-lactamase family protein